MSCSAILGVHRLRDLARPEHVWQLCHRSRTDSFPPLSSVEAVANNLPVPLTSFVGRDVEIDAVRTLVGESRLLTLTGAGGCGKTRLALAVAAGIADEHPDGICWVDLAPLSDASLVPAALAGVLGVPESPMEPITDTAVGYLSGRRALVGLDNCEHLIEACAALAATLIEGCAGVTVLATSRELLGVAGEAAWAVPPLSLPHDDAPATSESVQLFVDRARSSRPNFALTDENAPTVAEICTRLDGIPLAIELAAARTRLLTVVEIAEGLADRFHLLTGGGRTALPRQRTLEGSVDWSHDLLDRTEQAVFRRLAVFAGGFTLNEAEAVCAGNEVTAQRVLDLLSTLVDRSLVQLVDDAGAHALPAARDDPRLRPLQADRCWRSRGDVGSAPRLLRVLRRAGSIRTGGRRSARLAGPGRLGDRQSARRSGLEHRVRGVGVGGSAWCDVSRLYLFARSDLAIGRGRLEATLEDPRSGEVDRAGALGTLCIVCYRAGEMVKAVGYGDEAVAIGRRFGDPATLGRALHWRGWARFWGEADLRGGWADFEEADATLRPTDDRLFQALNLAVSRGPMSIRPKHSASSVARRRPGPYRRRQRPARPVLLPPGSRIPRHAGRPARRSGRRPRRRARARHRDRRSLRGALRPRLSCVRGSLRRSTHGEPGSVRTWVAGRARRSQPHR